MARVTLEKELSYPTAGRRIAYGVIYQAPMRSVERLEPGMVTLPGSGDNLYVLFTVIPQ